ncbi:recombinase family protein [Stackebrandtia nassauensis]|uniref:Recombinase n=1 Tax=Stackebrandtia nassauensis (strain DSM 44728 / CIP 108903 / NRRL B-16338 / NBRC 102104 / LLR-40K-21) TaxID=446470 RepID=D3Q2C3_STANL|nr:recombinase family protein [Stackebrandtia nassauensis]ADD43856.1 Recombinase [Stackebrandtia nassauensis DSM 44728]
MDKWLALYCRASQDKRGFRESVGDQETWGRAYGAKHFPDLPIKVYIDNDLSAADPTVFRPDFERLREDVRMGHVAQIWSVEQYRLVRQEVEWFSFAAELVEADIIRLHTDRDGVILVDDDVAGIKAVLGGGEVRRQKKRLKSRQDAQAAKGWPAGSRPFGYVHARVKGERTYKVVPEQAEALRWAAGAVVDGWSLTNIAAELTARGFEGAHRKHVKDEHGDDVLDEDGNPVTLPTVINAASVKRMVSNPSVAGWRVHRGQISGRGNWEPILTESLWQQVRTKLSAPRTVRTKAGKQYPVKTTRPGGTARRYELSGGTITCGKCEAPLVGSLKQLRNKKGVRSVPYYFCHPMNGGRSCMGIMAKLTEKYVAARLIKELNKPAVKAALAKDNHAEKRDELTAELVRIDGQRPKLAKAWAADALSDAEWLAAREELDEREAAARAELVALPAPTRRVDPALIADGWDEMTLDERREIISMFVENVTILPARPGLQRFDSDRVKIKWREL